MRNLLLFLALCSVAWAGGLPPGVYKCGTYPSRSNPYSIGEVLSYDVGSAPQNPGQGTTGVPPEASCGRYHADLTTGLTTPTYISGTQSLDPVNIDQCASGSSQCTLPQVTFETNVAYSNYATMSTPTNYTGPDNNTYTAYGPVVDTAMPTCDISAQVWDSCDKNPSACGGNSSSSNCTAMTVSAQQQAWNQFDYRTSYQGQYPYAFGATVNCHHNYACHLSVTVDLSTGTVYADDICNSAVANWLDDTNGQVVAVPLSDGSLDWFNACGTGAGPSPNPSVDLLGLCWCNSNAGTPGNGQNYGGCNVSCNNGQGMQPQCSPSFFFTEWGNQYQFEAHMSNQPGNTIHQKVSTAGSPGPNGSTDVGWWYHQNGDGTRTPAACNMFFYK